MSEMNDQPQSRTHEDLRTEACRVHEEEANRIPRTKFGAREGTELVDGGTMTGWFAQTLVGFKYALVAAHFPLGQAFEHTVEVIVERAWEWRERTEKGGGIIFHDDQPHESGAGNE